MWDEQEYYDEQMEKERRAARISDVKPRMMKGNIRNVKKVPIRKYWEEPGQISQPVSEYEVQQFLAVKDDLHLNLRKKVWGIALVLAVILVAYCRGFM